MTDLPPILTPPKTPKTSETMAFIDNLSSSVPDSSDKKVDTGNEKKNKTSFKDATILDSPSGSAVPTAPTKILYAVQVNNIMNSKLPLIFEQPDEPFDLSRISDEASKRKAISDQINKNPPIFQILTVATGYDKREMRMHRFDRSWMHKPNADTVSDSDDTEAHSKSRPQGKPLKLEDVKIDKILETRMEIYSHSLLEIIREVVDYYPT